MSEDTLKQQYGWDGKSESWNTWIIVEAKKDYNGDKNTLQIKLVYCTSEKSWNELKETFKDDLNNEISFESNLSDAGENLNKVVDDGKSKINKVKTFKENIQKDPFATLITFALDLLRIFLGDTPQRTADSIQAFYDGTWSDFKISYKYDYLKKDGSGETKGKAAGNRDKYTKVGECKIGEGADWQRVINVEVDEDGDLFADDATIPVIRSDLYTVAVDHIDMINVNFLENDSTNDRKPKGIWKYLSSFAKATTRIMMYLVTAFLLTMLLWYGVKIIGTSFSNPAGKKEAEAGLERFYTAVAMLVRFSYYYVFMCICK